MAGRGGILNFLEFVAVAGSMAPNPWLKGASILAGVIISSIPVKRPKAMDGSQSYGWEHTGNKMASAGTPMPVIYGKTRVKPVLKNRYIMMDGDRQWLYALYSFAGHGIDQRTTPTEWTLGAAYAAGAEVKSSTNHPGRTYICTRAHTAIAYGPLVFAPGGNLAGLFMSIGGTTLNTTAWRPGPGMAAITEIEINGNPIADYDPAAVVYETRPGWPLQELIPGFGVTYQNNYNGTALKSYVGTWSATPTYQVGEIVYLYFSPAYNKLYACTASNTNKTPPNAAYWSDLGTVPIDMADHRLWPDAAFTEASVATSDGTELYVDILFPYGLNRQQVQSDGTHLMQNGVETEIWYKTAADTWANSVCLYGGERGLRSTVRKTQKAFHQTFSWEASSGSYDLRILFIPNSPSHLNSSNYYEQTAQLDNVASLVYAAFTYPGEPLLGIKILATEKLQGDIEVTAVCQRSKVWVYDTSEPPPSFTPVGWVELDADNHAWAIYDLLVQGSTTHPSYAPADLNDALPMYGCGIPHARVDYASFLTWANFIDTLNPDSTPVGYHLDIVFDDFMTIWDAVTMIAFEGRGAVMPYGAMYYAIPDMAKAATALICEGNIVANSLTQAWGDLSKRANSIEVTYKDEGRGYDDVTFIARSVAWADSPTLTDAVRQTLYGTTKYAQAYRIAKYFLTCNETLTRMVNLEMDVEGVDIAAGDVVNLQHAALGLGVGGRIVSYEENLLNNPSFKDALLVDTGKWSNWGTAPEERTRIDIGGDAVWSHWSTTENKGLMQTVSALPGTTYTISAYIKIAYLLGGDSLAILSHDNQAETSYVFEMADLGTVGEWQRVELTFTTAPDQYHITVWLGGIGRCYWDNIVIEKAAAATAFILGSRVTIDRTVTLAAATTYGMKIRNLAGTIETHTDTTDEGTFSAIRFDTRWLNTPEPYSPYCFGLVASYFALFRVIEARRSGDMRKRLTLMQYDADVYDIDTTPVADLPKMGFVSTDPTYKPVPETFNKATYISLSEFTSRRPTGEYQSNIVVSWSPTDMAAWGKWEVVFRDVTAGDPNWAGAWAAGSYDAFEKVTYDGKAYISLVDGNTGFPFSI